MSEPQHEPTFEDVLEAIKALDARLTQLQDLFAKHEHKSSGELVVRFG